MIVWGERLGPDGCCYVRRWILDFGAFSLRLHHWFHSDDMRAEHDHQWDFASLVLWGSVFDRSGDSITRRGPLSLTFFRAEHRHSVEVRKPSWTLLICGRPRRKWGYWVGGRFRKRNKYYFENGHHDPCA